jgi:wyosine [tRNA(Phe)-imidazoG37] synthetase (radical SAM superfamily)
MLPAANQIIIEHIDRFKEDFLRFVVRPKYTTPMDGKYVFEPFINQYFNGWFNFRDFLENTAKDNSEFTILVKYFNDYEKTKYSEFVSLELPPFVELNEYGNVTMKAFKDQDYKKFLEEMTKKYPD